MTRAVLPWLTLAAVLAKLAFAVLFGLFFAAAYPIAMIGECGCFLFRRGKQ